MPQITKIELQKNNKSKVNLYIDDEFYTRLYIDICVKCGLKVGKEISYEKLSEVIESSEKELALNKTVKYISSALKTKKQVRDYLNKKEFDKNIIDYVINKLEEYKYIDDEEYVKAYVNTYKGKYGCSRLRNGLKQKGISQKLIDEYFADNLDDLKEESPCKIIAMKYIKNKPTDDKTRQKLFRFLAARGFDYDEITSVVREILKEN